MMSEVGGMFMFDCPARAVDLSSKEWLTDEVKAEFDTWFQFPHEEMPKAPSDEEIFEKLLNSSTRQSGKTSNENCVNGQIINKSTDVVNKTRKRASAEMSSVSSHLMKPQRNHISSLETSGLTRPAKVMRPNVAASSSITASNSANQGVNRATASSSIRAMHAKNSTRAGRTGSAQKLRPVSSCSSTVSTNLKNPSVSLQTKDRSNSAGKVRPSITTSTTSVTKGSMKKGAINDADASLKQLLKAHNAKFVPVPAYEPPKHSVREVRNWEKLTGKLWCELKPEERQAANDEISRMKESKEIN
jgi:hypothetical protein